MIVARYMDPEHTSYLVESGVPGAPLVGETGDELWETLTDIADFEEPQVRDVPQAVSNFQARTALRLAGYYEAVKTIVDASDDIVKDAWYCATEFQRDSPTVLTFASALGLTDTQIDDLFVAAAQVRA